MNAARYVSTGQDNWTGQRGRQSDADRLRTNGPLVPLDEPPGLLASVPLWASAIGIAVVVMMAVWR